MDRSLRLTRRCQILADLGAERILVEQSLIDVRIHGFNTHSYVADRQADKYMYSNSDNGRLLSIVLESKYAKMVCVSGVGCLPF